jgi:hypothetical protein
LIIEKVFAVPVWGCHASGVLELAVSAIFCLLEVMVRSGYGTKWIWCEGTGYLTQTDKNECFE